MLSGTQAPSAGTVRGFTDDGGQPYVLAQARAGGGVVATRPVAVELDWQRGPMVLDQVVVTGFGGMAWWLGRVAVVGLAAKKTHVVYYEGDGTKVAINLSRKSYGPAKITPAARGSAEKVEFGWMLALPTEVAAAAGVRHRLRVRRTDDFLLVPPVAMCARLGW